MRPSLTRGNVQLWGVFSSGLYRARIKAWYLLRCFFIAVGQGRAHVSRCWILFFTRFRPIESFESENNFAILDDFEAKIIARKTRDMCTSSSFWPLSLTLLKKHFCRRLITRKRSSRTRKRKRIWNSSCLRPPVSRTRTRRTARRLRTRSIRSKRREFY